MSICEWGHGKICKRQVETQDELVWFQRRYQDKHQIKLWIKSYELHFVIPEFLMIHKFWRIIIIFSKIWQREDDQRWNRVVGCILNLYLRFLFPFRHQISVTFFIPILENLIQTKFWLFGKWIFWSVPIYDYT